MTIDSKAPYLSQLRDRRTQIADFRIAAHHLAELLARETTSCLPLSSSPITLVPILRSGLALFPAFLELFPHASAGILGLRRNPKVGMVEEYVCNMPSLSNEHRVIILDPLIATGGTVCRALSIITEHVPARNCYVVGILSATPGVQVIKAMYPEANLIVAANDEHLDDENYIVPGLGDFGDRYFGTVE